eukprot:m.255437 g.255437  ORF g.255437 m.255437 type:complete len:70 (-) comp54542_c1_seq4:2341-2550(-)
MGHTVECAGPSVGACAHRLKSSATALGANGIVPTKSSYDGPISSSSLSSCIQQQHTVRVTHVQWCSVGE